jgi:hypothetical protein
MSAKPAINSTFSSPFNPKVPSIHTCWTPTKSKKSESPYPVTKPQIDQQPMSITDTNNKIPMGNVDGSSKPREAPNSSNDAAQVLTGNGNSTFTPQSSLEPTNSKQPSWRGREQGTLHQGPNRSKTSQRGVYDHLRRNIPLTRQLYKVCKTIPSTYVLSMSDP